MFELKFWFTTYSWMLCAKVLIYYLFLNAAMYWSYNVLKEHLTNKISWAMHKLTFFVIFFPIQ